MFARLILFAVALCWLAACTQSTEPQPNPSCTPTDLGGEGMLAPVFCADPSTMQPAAVIRVIDGDTVRVAIDGREEPVRFYGIDAPERGEPCFTEATDRARELVAGEVRLVGDARDRDRNDRLLRYVYTPDGLSIDATLISEGLAHAWTDDGRLRDALVDLEAAARTQGAGCLWHSAS